MYSAEGNRTLATSKLFIWSFAGIAYIVIYLQPPDGTQLSGNVIGILVCLYYVSFAGLHGVRPCTDATAMIILTLHVHSQVDLEQCR
jgi:hypothetical protein